MSTVLFFDVDGTLVNAAGAGRRALEQALEGHCGPLDGCMDLLRLDGMTDRLIVREVMAALGRPFEDVFCDRVLASYLEHLAVEILMPRYRVLPGVPELLEALSGSGALVGLCTGNVAGGARIKLARGGIDRFFDWGEEGANGFGGDGEERERIVEAALRRASRRLGRAVRPGEALLVGDTPRDVAAGRAAGVPVLAVATGRFSAGELRACGADGTVESLVEAARLMLSWPGAPG